jgi:glycosyltransferase involved in cell wall biosynthesis
MRIIQVATDAYSLPPNGAGAIEEVIYQLTKHLSGIGCSVEVITIRNGGQAENSKVKFHQVYVPTFLPQPIKRIIFAMLATLKLYTIIKYNKIDVIHTHEQFCSTTILLAKKLFGWRIPIVHTTHNAYLLMNSNFSTKLKYILEIAAIKNADCIVTLTEEVAQQLNIKFNVSIKKMHIIPNGVAMDEILSFMRNNPHKENPKNGKMILCVGRVCPRKNQYSLVKAVPEVIKEQSNTRFVFVGPITDKLYFNEIRNFIREKHLFSFIEFKGEISRRNLYRLYQNATIFVLPTLSETQGLVILEAAAFGKPIITSSGRSLRWAKNYTLQVDPHNIHEIANAINLLLKDELLRRELAKKGKEFLSRKFSWNQIAQKTLEMYKKLKFYNRYEHLSLQCIREAS